MKYAFKKSGSIFLLGVCLFLFTILLWPLRYSTSDTEQLSDPVGSISVTPDKPVVNVQIYPSRSLVGVSFWTAEKQKVQGDTLLELVITNSNTGEVAISREMQFSHVFQKKKNMIMFTFPSIRSSPYLVSLRIPDASAGQSLTLRGPLKIIDDKTSAQTVVQVLEKRSLYSIFYTHLFSATAEGEDIYYYWLRGGEIVKGENPYVCSLDDTCINHKNPGHFPVFYWLSALSQQAGFHDFHDWIVFWRTIFLLCYLATGAVLFWTLYKRKQYELAVFALFFWLFNRWSLYVIRVAHVDFVAIFFLTASLVLFEKKRFLSLLAFGVSLGIKQVAIFLVPLYIIFIWVQAEKGKRVTATLKGILVMAIVPLISLIPFVIDSPKSVATGLLFSATRNSQANIGAAPLVSLLKIDGAIGVAPMVFLMLLVFMAAYRKKLSLAMSGLAIMLTFIAFNTVLFNQYFLWFVPFLPLAASEIKKVRLQ